MAATAAVAMAAATAAAAAAVDVKLQHLSFIALDDHASSKPSCNLLTLLAQRPIRRSRAEPSASDEPACNDQLSHLIAHRRKMLEVV